MISFISEIFMFSIFFVVAGFIVSYLMDFISRKPIDWWPSHALSMALGTFLTAALVFLLFSKKYIKYKCSQ